MDTSSPFVAMQTVERQIKVVLRSVDTDDLDGSEHKAVAHIKRLLVDARLDIRDYELSETRLEQVQNAVEAKNRLTTLQSTILLAGSVFGPADVAQLSAQLEQIHGWLL